MYEQNRNNCIFYGIHLSGINGLGERFCKVIVDDEFVSVYAENTLVKQLEKRYVKSIGVDQEYSNQKSTLGRGIIGAVLAGPIGAFIGAISAELDSVDMLVSSIEIDEGFIIFQSD